MAALENDSRKLVIIDTCEDCPNRYFEDNIMYCSKTGSIIGKIKFDMGSIQRFKIPCDCPLIGTEEIKTIKECVDIVREIGLSMK